jgi:three-Cys-motif partner protein
MSNQLHIGTRNKLDIIEKYVEVWVHKVLSYKDRSYFSGVVFIDAMSNCGMYIDNKSNVIKGTSLRIYDFFKKIKEKYPDKSFHIDLNDIDSQSIECQRCRINNDNKHINLSVSLSNLDISDYLEQVSCEIEKFKNKHTLLFYDPYKADIRWGDILKLLNKIDYMKKSGYDLIITHFYQNDPKRTMKSNIKNPQVIRRYELTYGMPYSKMIAEINNLSGYEQNVWFRKRIIQMIENKLKIKKSNIAYAPIFNSNNTAVYDIVFASHSNVAKDLFKLTMHKQMQDKFEKSEYQVALDFENGDYLSEKNISSEGEIFYSINNYAKTIAKDFSGRTNIFNCELESYLKNHYFIPAKGIKTKIDKKLIESYNVIVSKKNRKKVYDFPEFSGYSEV